MRSTHLARFAGGGLSPSAIVALCCLYVAGGVRVGGRRYREKPAVLNDNVRYARKESWAAVCLGLGFARTVLLSTCVDDSCVPFTQNHLGIFSHFVPPHDVLSLSSSRTRESGPCQQRAWWWEVPEATKPSLRGVK